MNCPNCEKVYARRDYALDERYFECKDCQVALVLSTDERLAELQGFNAGTRLDAALPGRPSSPFVRPTASAPSLLPLRFWIGLLIVSAIVGSIRGMGQLVSGSYVVGAVTLAYTVGLLVPTIVGLLWRMKFALYLTYLIFAWNFLSLLLLVMGKNPRAAGAPFAGIVVGAVVFGTIAVLWLRWFVRYRTLFRGISPRHEVVEDIYSPRPRRDV